MLCVTVEVKTDSKGDHTIGETFPLFSRKRCACMCVCVCVFLRPQVPRFQCGGKDEGDKANYSLSAKTDI